MLDLLGPAEDSGGQSITLILLTNDVFRYGYRHTEGHAEGLQPDALAAGELVVDHGITFQATITTEKPG